MGVGGNTFSNLLVPAYMNIEQVRIKEEMLRISNRWKDKNITKQHKDYVYMLIDRMKYRELKRKYEKYL